MVKHKIESILILFVVSIALLCNAASARGVGDDGQCKDTTVSGCSLREEDVIETVTLSIDEALCQDLCFQSTNCAVFHHTKDNCTLLTEDYRQDCQNAGGLPENSIDACLAMDLYTCDRFMEEDCIYTGDVLLKQESISDAKHCQKLCDQFQSAGCQYWVFQFNREIGKHECQLLKSDERNCTTKGGPRSPSVEDCLPSTTVKPTILTTTQPPCPSTVLAIVETFPLENSTADNMENWSFDDNGTYVEQLNNTILPAVGLGKEFMLGINYYGTFLSDSTDDDLIGFVFGFVDPTDFFVFYVPKYNTSNGFWKHNFRIIKVDSVTGLNGLNMTNAILAPNSVENQTEVIWRDNQPRGWLNNKMYYWHLNYRPLLGQLKLRMFEDNELIFDTGVLQSGVKSKPGRVGVFTYSQPLTFWQDMFYECDNDPLM